MSNAFLRSRLTTYNYYGKIFNLNFSIFSLCIGNQFSLAGLGRATPRETASIQLPVAGLIYTRMYSLTMTLAGKHQSIVTFEIKEEKQAKKKINNKMR